jgi:hypothetical protein
VRWRRVNVYEAFVEGAKDGFGVAITDHALPDRHPGGDLGLPHHRLHGRGGGRHRRGGGRALGLNTDFVPALPVGLMKTLSGSGARG